MNIVNAIVIKQKEQNAAKSDTLLIHEDSNTAIPIQISPSLDKLRDMLEESIALGMPIDSSFLLSQCGKSSSIAWRALSHEESIAIVVPHRKSAVFYRNTGVPVFTEFNLEAIRGRRYDFMLLDEVGIDTYENLLNLGHKCAGFVR